MRKVLWSLAGLTLGGFFMLTPRTSLNPVAPQGAHATPDLSDPARRRPPIPTEFEKSPFQVKAKDGPWMICAANYSGPDSVYLANQVVRQLRDKNINAFIYSFADRQRAEVQWKAHLELQRQNNDGTYKPRFTRVQGHTAVLIGGFKSMEDARAALPNVQELPAPDVRFQDGSDASDRYAIYAEMRSNQGDRTWTPAIDNQAVNPFHNSFVMRNPEAKQKTAQNSEVDPAWKKLNSGEPYSLLKNKKEYTLVVKVYYAPVQLNSGLNPKGKENSFTNKLGFGGSSKAEDVLEASANQAHELARVLRHFKLDAYVLHMRQGSLVAVGGFKELDGPDMIQMRKKLGAIKLTPQGMMLAQNNPQVQQVQREYGLDTVQTGVMFTGQNQDPMLDPIQLLPNPMPMRVPKL
jgi:hypothetical protein